MIAVLISAICVNVDESRERNGDAPWGLGIAGFMELSQVGSSRVHHMLCDADPAIAVNARHARVAGVEPADRSVNMPTI